MRVLIFAPLAVLLSVVFLTAYFLRPALPNKISLPPLPEITDAEAKVRYGLGTLAGEELIKKGNDFLARFQDACAQQHLTYEGPTKLVPESLTISAYPYWREGRICTIVTFHSDELELKFFANNKAVLSYWNRALEKRCLDYPYHLGKEKPKMSRDEAGRTAQCFLDICDYSKVPLAGPYPSFNHDGYNVTKAGETECEGVWRVLWIRVDGEGHRYQTSGRNVSFMEGDGPMFVGCDPDPPYYKDPSPIISQNDAEQRARIAMAGDGTHYGALHLQKEKSRLCICLPMKNIWNLYAGYEDEARLAYDLWFSCELREWDGEKSYWQTRMVTVDAHSGVIIGRDMMMGIGEREK